MVVPFLSSWITPIVLFLLLPNIGSASSTSTISLHCETLTSLIFDAVAGNVTIACNAITASKHTSPFIFDLEAALVHVAVLFGMMSIAGCFLRRFRLPGQLFALITCTTSTLEVDPHRIGLHRLILSIHGLRYMETFWYNDDSNVYDLQVHIRKLFKKLRIDDTFKIEHVCNRFSVLNSQGPKLHVKLTDLNLSPNWITIFPRKFLIPVSGGARIQTPTKKRKRASKLIRSQKKRKLNAKRDSEKRKQKHKRAIHCRAGRATASAIRFRAMESAIQFQATARATQG